MNKTDFNLLLKDNPGNNYVIFYAYHTWFIHAILNLMPHRFVVYLESSDDILSVGFLLQISDC